MIIDIPGFEKLDLKDLVLDFNGTMALDGHLLEGVGERIKSLSGQISVHVVTADTMGSALAEVHGLPVTLEVLHTDRQDIQKLSYVQKLGVEHCVCIGNGRNDRLMLREAILGVAVLGTEGLFAGTAQAADVLCRDICSALDLLKNPKRLIACLRS
ncbi:MAG: ATPase P [Deltaproteobacteria bacterium]|nr:ATPase P [Deltaproteobacteria bacterium]